MASGRQLLSSVMHIAFRTNEYPPLQSGGIGNSVRNLARAMVAKGHRVTVLGVGQKSEFQDHGVNIRFMANTAVPKAGWIWDIRRVQRELNALVRKEGVDIVEAHDWCGVSAGLHLACPVVVRCHGTDTYFAHLLRQRVRPSIRWAEWLALREADDVVSVSRFTAEVTRHLFGLPGNISVIPNGIDTTQFTPAGPEEAEPNTILYFGTIVRKKGVLDLCRAFSAVLKTNSKVRLQLIGRNAADRQSGTNSTWRLCQQLLSSAELARVEYLGAQPYDKLQDYVRRASLCAFPSYVEAFPLSWLEAMACEKAVIAYDIGWAREVLEPSVSGWLVPSGDIERLVQAINRLLSDAGKRRELGSAARCRVKTLFDSKVVAQQSIERYQQVLNSRS